MRASAQTAGISVKAYAGTTGVLLAMDAQQEQCKGLLGFAIEREGGSRPRQFLSGMAHFPGISHKAGDPVSSDVAPIQRFRWSDYRVFPDTEYSYTIYGAFGNWQKPHLIAGPSVTVRTSSASSGTHRVLFNRAAAASQAFRREFPEVDADLAAARKAKQPVVLPESVLAWLSRGVLEQITGFCARATDPTWALDVAIYEYELPAIIQAIHAARDRGAQVRIVYHAKPGDPQTSVNEANLADWPAALKCARVTNHICHDKFIIASRIAGGKREPQAVLCGSTNFTENGVYRQANVSHIVDSADVARTYSALFEELFGGADPSQTKAWIDKNNPLPADTDRLDVGFSPRSGRADLDFFKAEIDRARRDVLFCTAFALDHEILEALLGAPHDSILRLGLQNSRSAITGYHRDRTAEFTATAMLSSGLEGYLKETTAGQKGNILIHTKLIVLDFTSPSPTVISGSHNFSQNASFGNDENYLVVRGQADIADCYGVELMRLYDHYRTRWALSPKGKDSANGPPDPCGDRPPGTLCPDDRWILPYFEDGTLKATDRIRFAGTPA
jgi:hypothetical protein